MTNKPMQHFERGLWATRYMILIPVVVGVVAALGMIVLTAVDTIYLLGQFGHYAAASALQGDARLQISARILQIVEGYLLATILFLFSLGLYELFIGKIEAIEQSPFGSRVLLISSIDDLKERLGRVVLLALVIEFFHEALRIEYQTPQDLLYLALAVALIGGALYLSVARGTGKTSNDL